MSVFDHADFNNHQMVAFKNDPATGLKAIVAVHNNVLGPAMGGCRMFPYSSSEEALSDVLRLSRGMTYKSALADLPVGGGKSVIIGNPHSDKNNDLLRAMGDFIESLSGQYTTAEDSGTSVSDMAVMAQRTQYVAGMIESEKHGGDPSPITAYVGYHMVEMLTKAGAKVYAADISKKNIARVVNDFGVTELSLDEVLCADVDVLAPCALGGAISCKSINNIKAGIVAGAANNQLLNPEMGGELLARGILYAPDYVINAGGIIDVYYQLQGIRDTDRIENHVLGIKKTLLEIFQRSEQEGIPTSQIADALAEDILAGSGKKEKAA
jgi:leucine dehydrogenase